jgi:Rrf2 family nitric oxide-sensitive transcriptional repressor
MKLTQHADYGLRMSMYLALCRPETATVGRMAEALGLSNHHLMKVAQELRREGIFVSHRGRSGGLALAREPSEQSVGQIVRALESFEIVECFDESRNRCILTPACGLQGVLSEASLAFLEVLDRYTLAELLTKPRKLRDLVSL